MAERMEGDFEEWMSNILGNYDRGKIMLLTWTSHRSVRSSSRRVGYEVKGVHGCYRYFSPLQDLLYYST